MIDALIQGTLYKVPQARTASNGRRFATATVRTALKDGSTIFVSVIAFAESAVTALLALEDGDAAALVGELTPKVYMPRDGGEPRPSLDLVAHKVLTEYHVTRKRKAVAGERDERPAERSPTHETAAAPAHEELDDDLSAIPF